MFLMLNRAVRAAGEVVRIKSGICERSHPNVIPRACQWSVSISKAVIWCILMSMMLYRSLFLDACLWMRDQHMYYTYVWFGWERRRPTGPTTSVSASAQLKKYYSDVFWIRSTLNRCCRSVCAHIATICREWLSVLSITTEATLACCLYSAI